MKAVGIGGGHGLSRALTAFRLLDLQPTAVVTVADDGGSSGRLRQEHGVVALGDLRMALSTLADGTELAEVFQHRFDVGDLKGHALGNLVLLALLEQCDGDIVTALDRAGRLLGCQGRVLPSTHEPVQLHGCIGGREVGGQVRVATATDRVERVWLEPAQPPACPQAVEAIAEADLIVLGPGSLFTSVLAALLVPGIGEAVVAAEATVVLACNLLTQPGETSELSAADHVEALFAHVPGLMLDAVLLHDGPACAGAGTPLGTDLDHPAVRQVVCADLALRQDGAVTGMHDPQRLADALNGLLAS
ncbi:MAG TPA: uridine diphosphate-N-acetylglucosamine-binding protein YvcK [Egibacteraceae bacterium]|nr:uridine diphosphate-N-acetylglucosamine-binding protein YvcK [Egibacteraceae bacterium]